MVVPKKAIDEEHFGIWHWLFFEERRIKCKMSNEKFKKGSIFFLYLWQNVLGDKAWPGPSSKTAVDLAWPSILQWEVKTRTKKDEMSWNWQACLECSLWKLKGKSNWPWKEYRLWEQTLERIWNKEEERYASY